MTIYFSDLCGAIFVCLVTVVLMPCTPGGASWGSRRCLTRLGCLMPLGGEGSESLVCENNESSLALLLWWDPAPLASAVCSLGTSHGKRGSSWPWEQRLLEPGLLWWDFPLIVSWLCSIFWWGREVSVLGEESTSSGYLLSVGLPARFPLLESPCLPGVVSRTSI